MRGCDVLFGGRAVEVRRLLIQAGVAGCPCLREDACEGCPIMGDWGQRTRLAGREPMTEASMQEYDLTG